MKYRLELNEDMCVSRFEPKYKEAQKFLDNEVLKDSDPYVPMRDGYLVGSGKIGTVIGSGEIRYNTVYARYQYYGTGFKFSKEKHPQACAQWFEKAKATKLDSWKNGVQKIIKGK